MYYKHFEVFMHGREPIIVTGRTRSQVSRDFKEIYGPDKVDEVKPISIRGAESRLGLDFKQIVKSNTMVNTPKGNDPYINEQLETKDYGYYEVCFVGTDETDIVMGSSLESVKADMEEMYGDNLDCVNPIQPEELAVDDDSTQPKQQHQNNISILSGRNPFAEHLNRVEEKKGPCWTGYKKVPGKKDYEDGSCVKEDEELDEVSIEAVKKAVTHPTATRNPALQKAKEKLKSGLSAMKASTSIDRQNDGRTGMQTEGAFKRIAQSQSNKADRTASNDKLKPGLETYKKKSFEEQIEEKRGLWDNIHAKRKRIKAGSGERMRKPGSEGAPTDKDFRDSQKEEAEFKEAISKYDRNYNELIGKGSAAEKRTSSKTIAKMQRPSKEKLNKDAYWKKQKEKFAKEKETPEKK